MLRIAVLNTNEDSDIKQTIEWQQTLEIGETEFQLWKNRTRAVLKLP